MELPKTIKSSKKKYLASQSFEVFSGQIIAEENKAIPKMNADMFFIK